MQEKLQKFVCVTLLSFWLSGCVTIPNGRRCAVAGVVNAGAICAETQTDKVFDLNVAELIDLLEPQPERPDPLNPGQILPARPGAIITPFEDFMAEKEAYEEACRLLGRRCQREFRQVIENMNKTISTLRR